MQTSLWARLTPVHQEKLLQEAENYPISINNLIDALKNKELIFQLTVHELFDLFLHLDVRNEFSQDLHNLFNNAKQ